VKLIWAIVPDAHAGRLVDALVRRGFRCTRFRSRGGFLRAENNTLLLGVEDDRLAEALQLIRDQSRAHERPTPLSQGTASTAGATIFVQDVEHYERV
jgi:uncharacterized protein YaaQ